MSGWLDDKAVAEKRNNPPKAKKKAVAKKKAPAKKKASK